MYVSAGEIEDRERMLANEKPTYGRPWCRGEVFTLQPNDVFILRYDPLRLLPEQAQAILTALDLPENIYARCLPMGAMDIEIYRQEPK